MSDPLKLRKKSSEHPRNWLLINHCVIPISQTQKRQSRGISNENCPRTSLKRVKTQKRAALTAIISDSINILQRNWIKNSEFLFVMQAIYHLSVMFIVPNTGISLAKATPFLSVLNGGESNPGGPTLLAGTTSKQQISERTKIRKKPSVLSFRCIMPLSIKTISQLLNKHLNSTKFFFSWSVLFILKI